MPRKKTWPKRSKSAPPAVRLRLAKRKQWTEEQMKKATSECMPANRAATIYGVPKSTLKDHVSGRVVHGTKPGPRPNLDPAEEKKISTFLVSSAECGYGKTSPEVMTIDEKVANDKNVCQLFHSAWLKAVTPQNTSSGIWPLNRDAVKRKDVQKGDEDSSNECASKCHERTTPPNRPENLHPNDSPCGGPSLSSPSTDMGGSIIHLKSTTPSNQSPNTSHNSSSKTSPLSRYLLPQTPIPPQIKTGKARVLTSAECIAILEEKECKKKAEVEEKEKRKLEREAKKKEKEEEKKRKAEERAKKAEEKAKKAEEKAKKAEEKARGAASKTASKRAITTTRAAKRKNEAAEPLAKRAKYSEEEVEVDSNTCAICFGSYEEDLLSGGGDEWLQCTCGKWVHEECVEDCEADSDGNPRFCPSCVEQYM